jgi:hypothetical protein
MMHGKSNIKKKNSGNVSGNTHETRVSAVKDKNI